MVKKILRLKVMILFALSCTLFLSACPRDEEPILTEQISEDRLLGQVNSLSLTQISSHMIADMEIEGSLPLVNGKMEKVLNFLHLFYSFIFIYAKNLPWSRWNLSYCFFFFFLPFVQKTPIRP